jgi:DAK2 domain fusion protein YloV
MGRRSCDGAALLAAFEAAVAQLEAHVDEINALNVFPVPDGDTGSNMVATVRAALEEAQRADSSSAGRVAGALSFGALMGARGNSGVITSQVMRGFAEGLSGKRRFNGLDLAHALTKGAEMAYGAVVRPVEGTILTVIREAAAAAVTAAERENDIEFVLGATVDAAEKSVARTPSLLPILREAGVVDSGGQGLYRLFQGALSHVLGAAPARVSAAPAAAARPSALVAHADQGFGYETMFLLQAAHGSSLDLDAIRGELERIGESVLVAGDARAVKVHVHNERPDHVLAFGLSQGSLSRISIENLDQQAHEVRETRAAEFTGVVAQAQATPQVPALAAGHAAGASTAVVEAGPAQGAGVETIAPTGPAGSANGRAGESEPRLASLAVVAVIPGEGFASVYESFGVDALVRGGQTSNPSTGELLRAVEAAGASEVLVLPNNPNVILAARQVAAMSERPIVVVPTRNAAEGLSALLALDPNLDAQANAAAMSTAARGVQTFQVTEAVRDANIGGQKVRKGQTIALDPDDGLVAVDGSPERALLAGVAALEPGFELVTIYYGDGADLAEAERVARQVGEAVEGVEVEVIHGGQPHYRYIVAAE